MGTTANRKYTGTCETTGKRMYTSRANAKRAARGIGRGLAAYRCTHCDHWHNGHRNGLTREQHRAAAVGRRAW